jgi:YspA, cpYpsA-related SLOG family
MSSSQLDYSLETRLGSYSSGIRSDEPHVIVVLVCGGRHYGDSDELDALWLEFVLDRFHKHLGIGRLVQGGATGADALARRWAKTRCVELGTYKAQWARYGSAAGPIRNQEMLDREHPDLVVAFEGRSGTLDMKERAEKAGVKVVEPRRRITRRLRRSPM